MKRALAGALLLVASPASALTRDEVAKQYAPVFHQEVRDRHDLHTAFDFDGNWAGDDNGENVDGPYKLVGTVYYTVIETWSHWFIQYLPYHPLDTKVTNGHEHDTESVFVVVAKTGGLVAMETEFHGTWFTYTVGSSIGAGAKKPDGPVHLGADGRPQVYQQQVGHGICGGFSPPNYLFPDLQLVCDHNATPHVDKTGVIYRPDRPAAEPVLQDGKAVEAGYTLVPIETTFWARRTEVGPGRTYKALVDFDGDRCDVLACPKQFGGPLMGDEGDSPSFPWNQDGGPGASASGSQFFDPAYTMSRRLAFPGAFALDYCHNPYVGIVAQCPSDTPIPPEAPASPPAEEETSAPVVAAPPSEPAPAPSAASGCAASPQNGTTGAGYAPVALLFVAAALRRRR